MEQLETWALKIKYLQIKQQQQPDTHTHTHSRIKKPVASTRLFQKAYETQANIDESFAWDMLLASRY